jgi:CTP:molybdopterin cytidylyltransferase MocA
MSIRLDKPWRSLDEAFAKLRGNMGVFQLADEAGEVIYIGFAGGRSRYGLGGQVRELTAQIPQATQVRWEVTTAYQSRFRELLAVHQADHGTLPKYNTELNHRPVRLSRLSPA